MKSRQMTVPEPEGREEFLAWGEFRVLWKKIQPENKGSVL